MNKTSRILIFILLFSLSAGIICDVLYNKSSDNSVRIKRFQFELESKEQVADKSIDDLSHLINKELTDSLVYFPFVDDDISFYVFENDSLIFWSANHLDIGKLNIKRKSEWVYLKLPNSHCIAKLVSVGSKNIIALIAVKYNYPYENEELINDYAKGFSINKQINIKVGKPTDKLAVLSSDNDYLFSLVEPKIQIYDELYSYLGLIAYTIAFLVFLYLVSEFPKLLGKSKISTTYFALLFLICGFVLSLLLYFNIPNLLLLNKMFSPFQYASNSILASIVHLSVVTGFFVASIYLFYFNVDRDRKASLINVIRLQSIFVIYYAFVFYVLFGLIYHSSIQLSILRFDDFSVITLWIHFLVLLWGIGLVLLFYSTHLSLKGNDQKLKSVIVDVILSILTGIICWAVASENALSVSIWFLALSLSLYLPVFFRKLKNIYVLMAIWLVVYTAFIVLNSLMITDNKMFEKYKILAQNIYINGNTENDKMADILLEDLDLKIANDSEINRFILSPDSLTVANIYLNNTYLRGFWNKYEMRLNIASKYSDLYRDYTHFIDNVGTRLKDTHFYSVPANENNMSYIGAFPRVVNKSDTTFFYMEFYPRKNFKSYSFPNLLIARTPNFQSKLSISIAKYENHSLVFSSGSVDYNVGDDWISKNSNEFYSIKYDGLLHYVYAPNKSTFIVVSDQYPYSPTNELLYFIYLFLAWFSFCWLVVWFYLLLSKKTNYRLGLTAKFQYAFILLLIISFVGIFYVSVNFIQKKYQNEQIENLNNKKNYIQKELQEMYYWNQDLNMIDLQKLNFDLQDLSYIYHTDIHVYNNQGIIVGSSQPLIFNKSLISTRISPKPFFTYNSNLNQYEHIGELNYLTGYIDFYNGDYLQIGYIAIPQFFSQNEIRDEIESFLTVILHIYIIIIVLAILLSLFIGRQLSAPLYMIENKLKEMRLGQRNEKIDYTLNDEIGQLVIQYNRTVDELEQSAKLLAKSERESAWKSMARQVAHEINNPLTPMKLTIQQLQRAKQLNSDAFEEYFEKSAVTLIEQIDNLSRIAGTFSNFARMPEAHFEHVNLSNLVLSVVQLFGANNESVEIKCAEIEKDVYVYADPKQLVQVFNNLLKNAIQSIPEMRDGLILVKLRIKFERVIVEIIDNGNGIAEDISEKLFVPNFTTKNTGMGLGLAISKNIVEIAGGTITFSTKLHKGTTFQVSLPVAD